MSILVQPFKDNEFYDAISNGVASPEEVASFQSVKNLKGYLTKLGAKSMLVEDPYTDADFLDDYAAYYARCFSHYERRCKRIHFFRCELTREEFLNLLRTSTSADSPKDLQEAYLKEDIKSVDYLKSDD